MLEKTLRSISQESESYEILIVDGGSQDRTVQIAERFTKVYPSAKGRGLQMNIGARYALGDILLFLHADTYFAPGTLKDITRAVRNGFVGGCLTQKLEAKGWIYRWIEFSGNLRARLFKTFYGDQCIFVKKCIFHQIKGFSEQALFEDVDFSSRLRKKGPLKVCASFLNVSCRRWKRLGIVRTTFRNRLILLLYKMKVPVRYLLRMYPDVR